MLVYIIYIFKKLLLLLNIFGMGLKGNGIVI